MFGRTEKWWVREIERIQRAHREERAELIQAIAHLSGRPLPERGWDSVIERGMAVVRPRPIADPEQMVKD